MNILFESTVFKRYFIRKPIIFNYLILFFLIISIIFNFKEKKYARKFRVERTFSEKVVQQVFRQFLNIF